MKFKLGLVLATMLISSAYADVGPSFKVLLRKEGSSKTYYAMKEMADLESSNSFDGKYFKVVLGKNKEAITFEEKDQELLRKAATVYYHMNEARNFWVTSMESEVAAQLPKITVRLEVKNQYDDLGHFAHDNRSPQFNNALSVPEGETPEWVPADKQDKWGKEIWFRPMKSIPTKDLGWLGPNPLTVSLLALERPLIDYTAGQFNVRIMEQIFYPSYVSRPISHDLIQYAGTFALMKIFIAGSKHADPLFVDKYFYLDTAMVPEIAYHEYSHIVLSDHLEMSHSTPVNEGIADYFAAVQSKHRKIYAKVSGHSNAASKDTQEKKKYSHWDESDRLATSDFTLSVLWDVREALGEEVGDKVVYHARTYLKTSSSTVSDGLLRAILQACEDKCTSPRRDKLKLYEVFAWKGF
jgi:hypothetical protein